jgi:hypothetical protein
VRALGVSGVGDRGRVASVSASAKQALEARVRACALDVWHPARLRARGGGVTVGVGNACMGSKRCCSRALGISALCCRRIGLPSRVCLMRLLQ